MSNGLRWTEQMHADWKNREAKSAAMTANRVAKFGNVPTNGYHSKREAKRAAELQNLERAGEISELSEQVKFVLIPKQEGERECSYTADFAYRTKQGEYVVEDAKGYPNDRWPIKRKLMLFVHGIRVREV